MNKNVHKLFKYPGRTVRNFYIGDLKKNCGWVWVAGRVVGILDDGFVLQDESGRVDLITKDGLKIVTGTAADERGFGIGAIVEVLAGDEQWKNAEGKEITVFIAEKINPLAPCREDFFIGSGSPNYKKCVIDLMMKETLVLRTKIIKRIREFFWEGGFIEADTPELVRLPGMEPHLDVFKTGFTSLPFEGAPGEKEDLYLITSPEYAMKKLLVAGYEKIFQITKSFRNREHRSTLHNPEFTMLEWYRSYSDYEKIMEDTENLVYDLAKSFCGGDVVKYKGREINVKPPWPRIKVKDAFRDFAGIGEDIFEDGEKLARAAVEKGYRLGGSPSHEDAFFIIFMNEIEPKLGFNKPVILHEYPASMAALSKKCALNRDYAERFEVYIGGVELCNAFTELNDPVEQKERLESERKKRLSMGKEDYPVDRSFIGALEFGMPPSGGIALGVDRLIMLLTGAEDINSVLFFPHKDL